MAAVDVLTARRDVITSQDGRRRCLFHFVFRDVIVLLLASGFQLLQNITRGEKFLARLETALACSGDLPDSIGTGSPGI